MHALANMSYAKMNGAGNEIVVLDLRGSLYRLTADDARAIHALSPYDQLMVIHAAKTHGTDAFVLIFNNDGSQSGACGNGTRCVAWHLCRDLHRDALTLETKRGILIACKNAEWDYTVDMGEPLLKWDEIPLAEPFHDTRKIELQIGPIDAPVLHSPAVCNMGNPHCVFFVEDETRFDIGKVGPLLEAHPLFPEKANISIASVKSRDHVMLKVWERGVGITQACGSAACATVVSGIRKELLDRKARVSLPGGDLVIEWLANNNVLMSGPVEMEALRVLPADFGKAA